MIKELGLCLINFTSGCKVPQEEMDIERHIE